MATRTSQVIIQVDDKSLVELNAEIKTLETSIKNLKIGTQEWVRENEKLGVLKTRFKEVQESAKQLQGQIAKISFGEQIRGVAKLGAGMVGAFSAASGSLKLLGINSEAFDEMTAKATTLMSIMGGLNQVSELFSKTTLNSLKGVAAGFKGLVASVKTASAGMKAALISTGIGALIVGIGLLIANWDKLKDAVSGARKAEKKAIEDGIKSAELELALVKELNAQKRNQAQIQSTVNNGKTEEYNLTLKNYELSKLVVDEKQAELVVADANIIKLKDELKQLHNKFYLNIKNRDIAEKAKQTEIDLAVAKRKTLETELEYSQTLVGVNTLLRDSAEAVDKITEATVRLNIQRELLQSREYKQQELFENDVALIDEQIKKVKLLVDTNGDLSQTDKDRIRFLQAQKTTLIELNKVRIEQLHLQQLQNIEEWRSNVRQLEYNKNLFEASNELRIQSSIIAKANRSKELTNELQKLDTEGLQSARKIREDIGNFDLKRENRLRREVTDLVPGQIKMTKEYYELIQRYTKAYGNEFVENLESMQFFGDALQKDTKSYIQNLLTIDGIHGDITDFYDERTGLEKENLTLSQRNLKYTAEDLVLKNIINKIQRDNFDVTVKSLNTQRDALKERLDSFTKTRTLEIDGQRFVVEGLVGEYELRQKNLNKEAETQYKRVDAIKFQIALAKELGENTDKFEESKVEESKKFLVLNAEQVKLQQDLYSIQTEQLQLTQEIEIINTEIIDAEFQQSELLEENYVQLEKTTNVLLEQERVYKRLQNWVGKYNEEIQAGLDVISASMTLISTLFDEAAAKHQREIDDLTAQYDEMNSAEADRQDRILAYEEELKDAGGDRFDELLRLIDQEKAAKDANFISEVEQKNKLAALERKKLIDERKAALWKKAQNIIEAIIQTALAVIKALPNVFLAVASGVIGAAGVVTIAAQKVPDLPPVESKKEGGFTKRASTDDVPIKATLHSNEYVVPARVVRSPDGAHHIAELERMRNRSYAAGGFVAPANSTSIPGFEYEKLVTALTTAISSLPPSQVSLVAVDSGLRQVQLTKNNASISR